MSFRFTIGRAACGGQKYRISRSETEISLNIKPQHLTTQHIDVYVVLSTENIQQNAVDKENRLVSASLNLRPSIWRVSVRKKSDHRKTWIITHRHREDLKVDSGAFSVEEPLSIPILNSQESLVSAMWLICVYFNSLSNELLRVRYLFISNNV